MVHMRTHRHPEQQLLLDACTTSAPAVRTGPIATTRTPLPLGTPPRSVGVLAELRAADRTTTADHRRYDPDRLLPRTAMVRRVVLERVPLDDIDTVTAAILASAPGVIGDGTGLLELDNLIRRLEEDRPIPHANWDAWLADDWTHVNGRHNNLADATAREFARLSAGAEYAPRVLFAPLLSELTELKFGTIVDWRQALRVHAEDELALIDAEMAVAL